MPRKARTESPALLTSAELELMDVLWRIGGGSVRDVLEALPESRQRAYTSVSTILRILEQKGFVATAKDGKSHTYLPTLERGQYQARNLSWMVGGLFGGDPLALVRQLLSTERLSADDLREMQEIVEGELTR